MAQDPPPATEEGAFTASAVARGYDRLAARYAAWADHVTPPLRERYAGVLSERLSVSDRVLELGCGTGTPVASALSHDFAVVGVDLSWRMLRLARRNAPRARLVRADIASVAFQPRSFHGVAAFYSLIHVPRVHHAAVLARVSRWLQPGGLGRGGGPRRCHRRVGGLKVTRPPPGSRRTRQPPSCRNV